MFVQLSRFVGIIWGEQLCAQYTLLNLCFSSIIQIVKSVNHLHFRLDLVVKVISDGGGKRAALGMAIINENLAGYVCDNLAMSQSK